MKDDLQSWSELWRSNEVNIAGLVRRAQTAHRKESASRALAVGGVVFTALATAKGIGSGVLDIGDPVGQFRAAFALFAVVAGAWALWKWQHQIAEAQELLAASPASMVGDLKRLRERELYWWVGKPALGLSVALCLLALGQGVSRMIPSLLTESMAEEPSPWPFIFVVVALSAVIAVGRRRVATLRQELRRLSDLERELSS